LPELGESFRISNHAWAKREILFVVYEVPTEFDTVRAYQHGPAGGDPIVLVHCLYGSSPMWADQVNPVPEVSTQFAVAVGTRAGPSASGGQHDSCLWEGNRTNPPVWVAQLA